MVFLFCIEEIHALLLIMLKLVTVIQNLGYSAWLRTFVFSLHSVYTSCSTGMTLFLAPEAVWGLLRFEFFGFGWVHVVRSLI